MRVIFSLNLRSEATILPEDGGAGRTYWLRPGPAITEEEFDESMSAIRTALSVCVTGAPGEEAGARPACWFKGRD